MKKRTRDKGSFLVPSQQEGAEGGAMRQPCFPLLVALASLGGGVSASEEASPLDSIPDYSWTPLGETTHVTDGLIARNRTLLLNGQRWIARGVTYSPTPIGKDMSASEVEQRVDDFFIEKHSSIWKRDLPLMVQMGMTSLRVYELKRTGDHTTFLDLCYALNLTVIAGFPLHNAIHDLIDDSAYNVVPNPMDLNREDVKIQLREAIEHNRHPAIGMWLVGNEVCWRLVAFRKQRRCASAHAPPHPARAPPAPPTHARVHVSHRLGQLLRWALTAACRLPPLHPPTGQLGGE
jgi:hypothetical protein